MNLTQDAFGALFDVSKGAVSQWESKRPETRTTPTTSNLSEMSRLSGVPLTWLLDDEALVDEPWAAEAGATARANGNTPSEATRPKVSLEEALPLVLDAMARAAQRDKLRTALLAVLEDDAPAYRQRLGELLNEPASSAEVPSTASAASAGNRKVA